jgi:diguanylate cyclase
MQFTHSPERSTEVLRQALPLMSKQGAALHPMSYAVWYAYVADAGSALRQEVDRLLASKGKLDEPTTETLYHRFVAGLDADTVQRVSEGLQQVLGGMSAQAAAANDQTERYGQSLERAVAQLVSQADKGAASEAPGAVMGELLAQTQQMQAAMTQLKQQLADNQREIEQLRDEVQRARQESLVDTLTGLANRRAFDQRLSECLSDSADGQAPCLLLADLDHFKRVNDTYGHSFGDQVLRAVAQLLKALAPKEALAARIGGEEFALLLPATPLDQASALAERLRATVAANRIRRKGHQEATEKVTLSLGATRWRVGDSHQILFDRADRALYAAKAGGRDRVIVEA